MHPLMDDYQRSTGRRRRRWPLVALGILVAFALAGRGLAAVSAEPVANFWVDPSGGSCLPSASPTPYANSGVECGSLAEAFAKASPGQSIGVQSGVYPYQTLTYRASLQNLSPGCDPYGEWGFTATTNCIEIFPRGDVIFRGLTNQASSVWMHGDVFNETGTASAAQMKNRTFDLHITNTDLIGNPPAGAATDANCNCKSANFQLARNVATTDRSKRPDHVVFSGVDSDTASLYGASYVMLRKADVGPLWVDTPNRGSASGSGPDVPRIWNQGAAGSPENVVWDSVFVHEVNRTMWCDINNACHPDGLYITDGKGITIRNVGMSQTTGTGLFFEHFSSDTYGSHDVLIENSWFGCLVSSYPDSPSTARTTCAGGSPISIKNCGFGGCKDWLVRFNSWYSISAAQTSYTNARFVGNAGRQPSGTQAICSAATWLYNVFYTAGGGSNCGATNTNSGSSSPGSLFRNTSPGQEDFHLAGASGSTIADNFVTPVTSDYNLSVDADGDPRSPGSRDAGIDERGTAALPACSDGVDNDGDGLIDFPQDKGCAEPSDSDEVDPQPTCGTRNDLPLTVVAQTATTITFGWTPVPGATAYVFYADGKRVSWTDDDNRSTARFSKGAACYLVASQLAGPAGGIAG